MPRPTAGVQTPETYAAGITFIDHEGRQLSQSLKTSGGSTTLGAVQALAEAIADVSNASFLEVRNNETKRWPYGAMRVLDEAKSGVESVIVLVFPHDTDPDKNREVLIPAYDAQFAPNGIVDLSRAGIVAVISAALDIFNDDDGGINPDDYHAENVYGFTTTRKVSGRKSPRNKNIPDPIEPGDAIDPGEEPGLEP